MDALLPWGLASTIVGLLLVFKVLWDDWCEEKAQMAEFYETLRRLEEKFNAIGILEAKLDYLIALERSPKIKPENKKKRKGERK